jgi:O-antigen/teichoic acid export membrane protein
MNVYSHFAFSYLTRNTDNLLVGWRFGARALGFYKKAYDLFVLPETQLLAPLSAVVVSTLSRVTGTANNSNATFCGRYRFWRS